MTEQYAAMFSVCGEPFEMLGDPCDSREEAHQRCAEEATRWRCRTESFIKVLQGEDA